MSKPEKQRVKVSKSGVEVIQADYSGDMPSIGQRGINFAKAILEHSLTGWRKTDEKTAKGRLGICEKCERYINGKCSHPKCGCVMKRKIWWAESTCPVGKW